MSSQAALDAFETKTKRDVSSTEETQPTLTAADWRVTTLACECGADITEWHPPAQARRLVRVYGVDGVVPACPGCQSSRNGIEEDVGTVSKAVAQKRDESSVEPLSEDEQLAVKTRPEVKP